jgi:hypothetical protein
MPSKSYDPWPVGNADMLLLLYTMGCDRQKKKYVLDRTNLAEIKQLDINFELKEN